MSLPDMDNLKIDEISNDIFNHAFLPIISIYKLVKGFLKVFLCEFQKKNNIV